MRGRRLELKLLGGGTQQCARARPFAHRSTSLEVVARRGYLRPEVSVDEATDVLWVCSSVERYELLVRQREWSPSRFALFITDLMTTGLPPR